MASPSLLRSAAARVLRRSSLPSARSSRVFFSGVAGKGDPRKVTCRTEGEMIGRLEMMLVPSAGQLEGIIRDTQCLVEQHERFQRQEELQKKISYVLLPVTAAVYIFAPDRKGKSSAEEQASF